jgi:hypothetical protein
VDSDLQILSDNAHLRVVLIGGEHLQPCTICLSFRVGSRIVQVIKTAADPLAAYDSAVTALLFELLSDAESGAA